MSEWRRIVAEGRLDARLVLIGEAGGEKEERAGKPFVGASGHKLNTWWAPLKLRRADFYIDNVFPFRPPGNDLAALLASDYLLVHEWAANLHERLGELTDPWIIVPVGNIALRACMRRALDDLSITISKYRGSIMTYEDIHGRRVKMIPTIHPASIYHQRAKKARGQEKSNPGRTEKHCALDWQRIAREARFRGVDAPQERYYTVIEPADLAYWREEFDKLPPETPITVDIETPSGKIDCVGFAWHPEYAFTVPLRFNEYNGDHITGGRHPTFGMRHALIDHICSGPHPKVLQNGPYDTMWLWRKEGIILNNYCHELMVMHHALDPLDDHDLGYMKSAFLRGEYHKDEAKGEKARAYADSASALFAYNGMDCCTQIALFYELAERLVAGGRWNLYQECYVPLIPVLIEMLMGGMNTSRLERRIANARLIAQCITLQDQLAELVGHPLHAKKDLSRTKLQKYLYEDLKLPPQRKRAKRGEKGGRITIDEVALRKLQLKFPAPHPASRMIPLVLQHRRALKLASFLTDAKTDADGRLRSEIMPLTEAGRCSSKANAFKTGTNLQNQDRDPEVRRSFIPDRPEHVFLEVDCSQAESRIVYACSGNDELYHLAQLLPEDFDTHAYNAHLIFGSRPTPDVEFKKKVIAPDLSTVLGYVSAEQRYFGKRVEHGAQRGMGGETMADNLLKEDVIRTPEECSRMLEIYHTKKPGVRRYFKFVEQQILREKALTNSWGFRWDVRYEQMNADLYRRAYSFWPQSEVAFLLNVWGLVDLDAFLKQWFPEHGRVRIVMQVHDSILISIERDPSLICAVATRLHESMTRPRSYLSPKGPRALSMPVEFKLGSNWAFHEGIEFKRVPTVDEIESTLVRIV